MTKVKTVIGLTIAGLLGFLLWKRAKAEPPPELESIVSVSVDTAQGTEFPAQQIILTFTLSTTIDINIQLNAWVTRQYPTSRQYIETAQIVNLVAGISQQLTFVINAIPLIELGDYDVGLTIFSRGYKDFVPLWNKWIKITEPSVPEYPGATGEIQEINLAQIGMEEDKWFSLTTPVKGNLAIFFLYTVKNTGTIDIADRHVLPFAIIDNKTNNIMPIGGLSAGVWRWFVGIFNLGAPSNSPIAPGTYTAHFYLYFGATRVDEETHNITVI